MGYEIIDNLLDGWAQSRGVHLYKKHQDSEVRSADIVDSKGRRYQIWIDKPDLNGLVGIHVWDQKRRGRKRDFLVSSADLEEYLDSALKIAKTWGLFDEESAL
jgi:hypothetical protein